MFIISCLFQSTWYDLAFKSAYHFEFYVYKNERSKVCNLSNVYVKKWITHLTIPLLANSQSFTLLTVLMETGSGNIEFELADAREQGEEGIP